MKYIPLLLLTCALLFTTQAQAGNIKVMTETIKQPITVKASKSRLLDVVFNHTSHRGINCFTCHHMKSEKNGRYVPCSECHTTKGRSEEPLSMFKAAHAKDSKHSCYACHTTMADKAPSRYSQTFYSCRPCHTGAMPQEKPSKASANAAK